METITNELKNQSVTISSGFYCTHVQHGVGKDKILAREKCTNYDIAHRWAIRKLT